MDAGQRADKETETKIVEKGTESVRIVSELYKINLLTFVLVHGMILNLEIHSL